MKFSVSQTSMFDISMFVGYILCTTLKCRTLSLVSQMQFARPVVILELQSNCCMISVKQVFSDQDFIGWYSTGDNPNESDIKVHKQVKSLTYHWNVDIIIIIC